jgi:hypothetical protein
MRYVPAPRLSPGCVRQVCRHYYACPHLVKPFYRFFVKKTERRNGRKICGKNTQKYRDPINSPVKKAGSVEGASPDKGQIKYITFKKKMQAASMFF